AEVAAGTDARDAVRRAGLLGIGEVVEVTVLSAGREGGYHRARGVTVSAAVRSAGPQTAMMR
ncbi:MAG TPA: hypothetical protein DCR63_03055, partial [Microbacterium sp.]|nr:hypothetical protein [Microbacterium sp.]